MVTLRSDRLPRQRSTPKSPLTARQRAFADKLVIGVRPVDAYRWVYPHSAKWKGRRAAAAATRLANDPRVLARREDLIRRAYESRAAVATLGPDVRH